MEADYFTNLPSEITTNILSRLSIRSLAINKCVCKPRRNLLQSDDFVKSKIKTPPVLVRLKSTESTRCKIFKIEDEDEADLETHDLHYHPLTDLDIKGLMEGIEGLREGISVNGLLLIYSRSRNHLYICNPIPREYAELSCPEKDIRGHVLQFGFGVSKISGQYKVICINTLDTSDSHYVYTLGTGTWRRLEAGVASGFKFNLVGRLLCNGSLHWMGYDTRCIKLICGFDFETECFSTFSLPPAGIGNGRLCVLRDCLCYSYYTRNNYEIVIWMMKEYQVGESWTIEYKIITNGFGYFRWDYISVEAIKIFKDGDVLMLVDNSSLFYYSNKTTTLQHVDMFKDANVKGCALIFNPSLLSLKNFGFENVFSF